MIIKTIYPSFLGEVNHLGIGVPTIFIRLSGCNVRCYKSTLNKLCDTPEALEVTSGEDMDMSQIEAMVRKITKNTGIKTICLTGGEPLMHNVRPIFETFKDYPIITETNGTVDISEYLLDFSENNSFIVDYKLLSTGVGKNSFDKFVHILGQRDFVKFVVYDYKDYYEMLEVMESGLLDSVENIAAGVYWGDSPMSYLELFKKLASDGLAGRIKMNFQTHKLVHNADYGYRLFPRDL